MPARLWQSQLSPAPRFSPGLVLPGGRLSWVPPLVAIQPLNGPSTPLCQQGAAPLTVRRVKGKAFRLTNEDGEPPSRQIAAPLPAEPPQPPACRPLYVPGQILEVAFEIAAPVFLEPRNLPSPHAPRSSRKAKKLRRTQRSERRIGCYFVSLGSHCQDETPACAENDDLEVSDGPFPAGASRPFKLYGPASSSLQFSAP